MGQEIDFENWKCQNFDKSASNFLTGHQKILWGGSLGYKKLMNFTCLTMKFHNCHHTNGGQGMRGGINHDCHTVESCISFHFWVSMSKWNCFFEICVTGKVEILHEKLYLCTSAFYWKSDCWTLSSFLVSLCSMISLGLEISQLDLSA